MLLHELSSQCLPELELDTGMTVGIGESEGGRWGWHHGPELADALIVKSGSRAMLITTTTGMTELGCDTWCFISGVTELGGLAMCGLCHRQASVDAGVIARLIPSCIADTGVVTASIPDVIAVQVLSPA